MTFTPFSSVLLLARLPLMAAFSFSPSPYLQSFIISVIQGSPSTRCNICLDVLHMSCWRASTKWTDWEHFHLFTSTVGSSRVCQLVMNLINCAGFILFRTRLVWRKSTHCCSPVKHSVILLLFFLFFLSDLVGFLWRLSTCNQPYMFWWF